LKNKVKKKPHASNTKFLVAMLFLALLLGAGYWLYTGLYRVTPQFNSLIISKNGRPLKCLDGERIHLRPDDRISLLKISTNICFNEGVRLMAGNLDINALLYEELPFSKLLPDEESFALYNFRVEVKRNNKDIGHVDIVVEPDLEDWQDKVKRSITSKRKISVLKSALNVRPDENELKIRLLQEYKKLKQWDEAAMMLENMAKDDTGDEILLQLLLIYEDRGQSGKVISVLERLVTLTPEDDEIRYKLATVLEETGKYKHAILEYEILLKGVTQEDSIVINNSLGFLYSKIGHYKKAINAYLKVAKFENKDANLYYNLSYLYEKTGDRNRADQFLAKAVSLKTGDVQSMLKLAERELKKGHLKDAERYLKNIIKKQPNALNALTLLVQVAEKRNDKQAQKNYYYRIIKINPENSAAFYNLGIIEYETGNFSKALPHLIKYVKVFPEDKGTHVILFDIYRKLKKPDQVYSEASLLIKLLPETTAYYPFIFDYLDNKKKYTEIISVITDGLKVHPDDPDLIKYLVLVYLKTEKEDLAMSQMIRFLEVQPKDIAMLLRLARLQEKSGKPEEAIQSYKKILDVSPDHGEAEDAYLRLRLEALPLEK